MYKELSTGVLVKLVGVFYFGDQRSEKLEKILIFTLSTGGGHNEAAANLKGEFEQYGYKVIINDVFQDFNKIAESVMINSFNVVTGKLPKLYGMIYDLDSTSVLQKA